MTQPEPSLHTSSISLTDLAPVAETGLSPEETAAVRALPAGAALLVAHGGPDAGARFLLDTPVVTVGRHPESDILLDDVTVSRRHAEFRAVDGGHELVDLSSLNGTYVNNDRVDQVRLRTGMQLQIGRYRLSYHAAEPA